MQQRSQAVTDTGLTATEQRMIAAILAGREADLAGEAVRAPVVSALASGLRPEGTPGAAGIRVSNGVLEGRLDFGHARLSGPLILTALDLRCGDDVTALDLSYARLSDVVLDRVSASGGLVGEKAYVAGTLELRQCTFSHSVRLAHARCDADLVLTGCRIGDGAIGFDGSHMRIGGGLDLTQSEISGGCVLAGASLGQSLVAREASVAASEAGIALDLDGGRIGGDLILDGSRMDGSIVGADLKVSGRLAAHRVSVTAVGGGLLTSGLTVGGDAEIDDAVIKGRVCLDGASLGGRLSLQRCLVDGGDIAVSAADLNVATDWLMAGGKFVGQIRGPRAHIGGDLRLARAKMFGSEAAFNATGLVVEGGCDFARATIVGVVACDRGQIAGAVTFDGALIKVERGAAVQACGINVSGGFHCGAGFQTIGAVRLDHAVVTGGVLLGGAHLKSVATARGLAPGSVRGSGAGAGPGSGAGVVGDEDVVLSLAGARVDRLVMPEGAEKRPKGVVVLAGTHAAVFEDFAETWPDQARQREGRAAEGLASRVILDGFRYGRFTHPDGDGEGRRTPQPKAGRVAERRLTWLRACAGTGPSARLIPLDDLRYLAERLTAQGLEQDAALVALEWRRQRRRRRPRFSARRMASWLVDVTTVYGRKPGRALLGLGLAFVLFTGLWSWAANQCADIGCRDQSVFRQVPASPGKAVPDVTFHPLSHAFDRLLPPLAMGAAGNWRANIGFRPLARYRVPNIPLFVAGETDKAKL
ncbi:MAG: hypothetical protein KDJ36_07900, partial [Hyphomicrobiaceae bacterium]|nr:hypothetical protein [Hyphomicrobiaceae bacterium]